MFRKNIVKITEKLNKQNLLKICCNLLQLTTKGSIGRRNKIVRILFDKYQK